MNHKRILAIDLGSKRIGIAISDELNICMPHTHSIQVKGSLENSAKEIIGWYLNYTKDRHSVETILVGNPLTLDGRESKRTEISKTFCQKLEIQLESMGLDKVTSVLLWDERLTSAESESLLNSTNSKGIKGNKRRELKDQISAVLILSSYLATKKPTSEKDF